MINEYKNVIFGAVVLIGGLASTMSPLVATGTAPTIEESTGTEKYVLISTTELTLTASGGTAAPPTETAQCPPWMESNSFTYEWSDGTVGATINIDISSSGDLGEYSVQGVGQEWVDLAGTSAAAPTDTTESASITIHAVEVKYEEASYSVVDGDEVEIKIIVEPATAISKISDGDLQVEPISGGVATNVGFSSAVEVGSDGLTWRIANAYWYENSEDPCDNNAKYGLVFTYELDGVSHTLNGPDLQISGLVACGSFLGGYADYVRDQGYSDGDPTYEASYNSVTKVASAKIKDKGTFARRVLTMKQVCQPETSQFYEKIVGEEDYHRGQLEYLSNSETGLIFFDMDGFYETNKNITNLGEIKYTGSGQPSPEAINQMKQDAIDSVKGLWQTTLEAYESSQIDLADAYINENRSDLEQDAKDYTEAEHLLSMECSGY